ncbi:MAG: hypothetical protein M3N98_05280 [Actinomycetota bacterium]|nr:hypothetical protein [Actinomycetota bacterium]
MPFLIPITAAWIVLTIGVMAYYFLRIAPIERRQWIEPDGRQPTFPAPAAAGPSWSFGPTMAQRVLPTYDLAAYPTDRCA